MDHIEPVTITGPRGGSVKVWQAVANGALIGEFARKIDAQEALDKAIEKRRTFEGFTASVDYDRQDWQHATITQDGKPVLNISRPRMFGEFKTWTVTDAIGGCVYDSRIKPSLATLARLARAYVETMQEGAAYRVAQEVTTPEQEEWLAPVEAERQTLDELEAEHAAFIESAPVVDSPDYDLAMSVKECISAQATYGEDLVAGYAEGLTEIHGGTANQWESAIRAMIEAERDKRQTLDELEAEYD